MLSGHCAAVLLLILSVFRRCGALLTALRRLSPVTPSWCQRWPHASHRQYAPFKDATVTTTGPDAHAGHGTSTVRFWVCIVGPWGAPSIHPILFRTVVTVVPTGRHFYLTSG